MTATMPAGMHLDVPELEYHALPGLSSTGVKNMLKSPAHYKHSLTHRVEKTVFDVGHAAHAKILGVGMRVVEYRPEDLTPSGNVSEKAATKAWASEQRAAGLVPVTPDQVRAVDAMAEAVVAHRDAGRLLEHGLPEVSLLWDDPQTGARCRGRLDYLHETAGVIVDLKTCRNADPREFAKTAANLGYDIQAAHYLDGLLATRGGWNPRFLHVLVESEEPHLVSVVELDADYLEIGRAKTRAAIDLYARCLELDEWPGYPTGITRIAPPRWHTAPDLTEETAS